MLKISTRIYHALTHGPCRACGRRWLIGWMFNNMFGVCSWRCFSALSLREHLDA